MVLAIGCALSKRNALFNEMHPGREPISQLTVSRIERKLRKVRDWPKQDRPEIDENIQQDITLSAKDNRHCTRWGLFQYWKVSNIFKRVEYHPYEVCLVHGSAGDDFDRRIKFCKYIVLHLKWLIPDIFTYTPSFMLFS